MARNYQASLQTRSGQKFEDQIRRLIYDYFDKNPLDDSLQPKTVAEGEVDILVCSEKSHEVYVIEASKCRQKSYVEQKIEGFKKKNVELRGRYPRYTKRYWFIFEEPQSHQHDVIDKFNSDENSPFEINLLSFDELKNMVEEKDKKLFKTGILKAE
jgi:hypothetical protein